MKVDFDYKCIEDIINTLKSMGEAGEEVYDEALKEGALPMLAEVIARCPVSDINHVHARSKLKINRPEKDKGIRSIKIGIQKGDISDIYYLKFVEYGTSKMSARPFMEQSYNAKIDESQQIIMEKILRELEEAFNE